MNFYELKFSGCFVKWNVVSRLETSKPDGREITKVKN